jgi:hypothetical protein
MSWLVKVMSVCLLLSLAETCLPGQQDKDQSPPVPAATFSQFQCTGFIADARVPPTITLFNGADNDLYEGLHTFTPGSSVYLRSTGGESFQVGEAFSLVRPETGFFLNYRWLPGMIQHQIMPFASNFKHQIRKINELGFPYDNTGLVRVVRVTPEGAIARVEFACTAINPQDIAVPYTPQPIPEYVPGERFDRFALPNGKVQGIIVAASAAAAVLAKGNIAYLDIGQNQGVTPGQRYRIYAIFRDNVFKGLQGLTHAPETPRETVGELVILHVQAKAAEGIVIDSLREISVGDGVELE